MKKALLGLGLIGLFGCDMVPGEDFDFVADGDGLPNVYRNGATMPMEDVEKSTGFFRSGANEAFLIVPHRYPSGTLADPRRAADAPLAGDPKQGMTTTMRVYRMKPDGSGFLPSADPGISFISQYSGTFSLEFNDGTGFSQLERVNHVDLLDRKPTGLASIDQNAQMLGNAATLALKTLDAMKTFGDEMAIDVTFEPDNFNPEKLEQVTQVMASLSEQGHLTQSIRDAKMRRIIAFTGPTRLGSFRSGDTLVISGADWHNVAQLAREFGHAGPTDNPPVRDIAQRVVSEDASGCSLGGSGSQGGLLLLLGAMFFGLRRRRR